MLAVNGLATSSRSESDFDTGELVCENDLDIVDGVTKMTPVMDLSVYPTPFSVVRPN